MDATRRKKGKQTAIQATCFALLTGCDPEQEARPAPMQPFFAVQASNCCTWYARTAQGHHLPLDHQQVG